MRYLKEITNSIPLKVNRRIGNSGGSMKRSGNSGEFSKASLINILNTMQIEYTSKYFKICILYHIK
jgi:hypothetical protein